MKKYLKLIRVKNYIKNLMILLPVLFGKQLFNTDILPRIILGFLSFCTLSSAVYIFNDLCDAKRDSKHPIKCKRPIANNEISKKKAVFLFCVFIILSFTTNYFANGFGNSDTWTFLITYLILNILYSLTLKQVPIIDITIISFGFLIRLFYGSALSDISVSKWLYLTVIAVSFYIGFGKRRNEMYFDKSDESRPVLKEYCYNFLDKNMYVCSAIAIVFYALWSVDSTTAKHFNNNALISTVPLVILICITYSLTVEKCNADDPVDILLKNKHLLSLVVLYGLTMFGIIYIV